MTNALMKGHNIFPNRAVQSMALAHREKLGQELLKRSRRIFEQRGRCDDNGARIGALLDAGADLSLRQHEDGSTALLLLIGSGNLVLSRLLLQHDSPVNLQDDDGEECIRTAEKNMKDFAVAKAHDSLIEWKAFIDEIRSKAKREKMLKEEKEKARSHANEMLVLVC